MNIGSTIKHVRERKKVTLDVLAGRSGLSKGYLSLVENNRREPSMSSLAAIGKALDVPIEVIVLLAAKNATVEEINNEGLEALKAQLLELVTADE